MRPADKAQFEAVAKKQKANYFDTGKKGQKLIENRFIKRVLHGEAKWILNIEHWEKPQNLIKNGLIKRIFLWNGTRS